MISNMGRMKTIGKKNGKNIIKRYGKDSWGYNRVKTHRDGVKISHSVHRTVAIVFIPNPDNKPQVNHKNKNIEDNRVENLEWVTASENVKHAFSFGDHKSRTGEGNSFYGKKHSEATKQKIREARTGKALSEEHRKKIAEGGKKRWFNQRLKQRHG